MINKNSIKSFRDLIVYNSSYNAMLLIMKDLLMGFPEDERYDLKLQLSRSCKAIPRLIAEGYSKRHQKRGFQKYLDDALAESNETLVSLEQVRDIYNIKMDLVNYLILEYDRISRQIYCLGIGWHSMKK
ncbi:MAG: four helix bundle protein [Candidatus Parcubacteria bacterium]|nr:four helix bundle protein [Candidatus Parcubacteria bacterium]